LLLNSSTCKCTLQILNDWNILVAEHLLYKVVSMVSSRFALSACLALTLTGFLAPGSEAQYNQPYGGQNYANGNNGNGAFYQPQPMQQPMQQMTQPVQAMDNGGGRRTDPALLKTWFARYDQVRRQAQMSPTQRRQADNMMSQGLSMFVPGDEKLAGQKLLTDLVNKYTVAINQLKQLPVYSETNQLHHGYYQYFTDARVLFSDYLKVQNEPFAKDPNTGERLIAQIVRRKASLAELEANVKNLDSSLRSRLGIKAYQY